MHPCVIRRGAECGGRVRRPRRGAGDAPIQVCGERPGGREDAAIQRAGHVKITNFCASTSPLTMPTAPNQGIVEGKRRGLAYGVSASR